jgi:hypothetical protein
MICNYVSLNYRGYFMSADLKNLSWVDSEVGVWMRIAKLSSLMSSVLKSTQFSTVVSS